MTEELLPYTGRPRTTTDDLPENWRELMIECGRGGGSIVEMRALLGIAQTAWQTLLKDSAEFRFAERHARTLCEVWWERRGREMATGSEGNATVWIFNMKNRFNWRDKQDVDHTTKGEPVHQAVDYSKLSTEAMREIIAARNEDDDT